MPDSLPLFHVVIPARLASARLANKALLDIGGLPMVVRTALQAKQSGAASVLVATDAEVIVQACAAHGISACMTSPEHSCGTDRLAEVARQQDWSDDTLIVNVQGDEPFIEPETIAQVARCLAEDAHAVIATAAHRIHNTADFLNPNIVKVVCNQAGHALYFSRAPIPFPRDGFDWAQAMRTPEAPPPLPPGLNALRHIGLYAYRTHALHAFTRYAPTVLETTEMLEQLRALHFGWRIAVLQLANCPEPGIDTLADLELARQKLKVAPPPAA